MTYAEHRRREHAQERERAAMARVRFRFGPTVTAENVAELRALVDRYSAQQSADYWRFTRCANAGPPLMTRAYFDAIDDHRAAVALARITRRLARARQRRITR